METLLVILPRLAISLALLWLSAVFQTAAMEASWRIHFPLNEDDTGATMVAVKLTQLTVYLALVLVCFLAALYVCAYGFSPFQIHN